MPTDKAYYRALHRNQWPNVPTEVDDAEGVLDPRWVPTERTVKDKATGRTFIRTDAADVTIVRRHGEDFVKSRGGTSLHDCAGAMQPHWTWKDFTIPEGTDVPAGLQIVQRGADSRHYQIEITARMMEVSAFRGALDTLMRNAIARQKQLVNS